MATNQQLYVKNWIQQRRRLAKSLGCSIHSYLKDGNHKFDLTDGVGCVSKDLSDSELDLELSRWYNLFHW